MAATIGNLSQYQGADATLQDTIYNSVSGNTQNITGWALAFYIHAYGDPGTVFVTKNTAGSTINIPNGANGVANISMLRADTVGMLPTCYGYFVERADNGSNDVVSAGLFTLQLR